MKREEIDHEEGNVRRLLRQSEAAPRIGDEARERVLAHLLREQARRASPPARALSRLRPRLTARRTGAALGVLALAAGVALLLKSAPTPPAPISYENDGSAPRRVSLSDGTEVVLDVGARLIERGARDVMLVRGQAVFDVKDRTRRFDVEVEAGRASAHASRFFARASEQGATIAVAKGRVVLANVRGQSEELRAGEQGVLSASASPAAEPAPRVSHLFAFARSTDAPPPPNAPRKKGTLTARDPRWSTEEPLDLRAFDVDVHVEDGVARTTIDQTYFNPRPRQLEGIYAFPVPEGAALSRLAMYVDGTLMEGSIVERNRGRDIYEGIVEARRDPALLEWMSGNTFRMRVFPLPARSEKRLFMSYTQPLEHLYGVDRLTVPIPNVEQTAARASFRVRVVGGADLEIASPSHEVTSRTEGKDAIVSFKASDYPIGQDLVLTLTASGATKDEARSFRDGKSEYLMVRHEPDVRAIAREAGGEGPLRRQGPRRVAVLFDVSASRGAEDLEAQSRFVDGLVDALDDADEVTFVTVGYEADVMPGGLVPVSELDRGRVAAFLGARAEGVGSTRLDLALKKAADLMEGATGEREIVYVGDGVLSSPAALGAPLTSDLPSLLKGKARFIGVAIGDSVDEGALGRLADATGGWVIDVGEEEDLAHRAFDLVAATYTPCITGLRAELVGADGKPLPGAFAVPASPRLCDGERLDVVARADGSLASPAAVKVRGRLGERAWEHEIPISGARAGAAYLPRLFAERRVASLLAEEPPGPGRAESPHAAEITELAKRHFLVTPFTSLLVLENDAMYKEYGVEKKKAEGWALYEAPERIEVKVESLATTAAASTAWDVLERSPLQLFYDYRGRTTGELGLIGAIGFGGGPGALTGRGFGGGGRGQGFGSGSGRLGGSHRERADVPNKVSTRTLLDSSRLTRRGPQARPLFETTVASVSASDELSALPELRGGEIAGTRGLSGGVLGNQGDDWLASAFRGESLARYGHAYDDALNDLTAHVPSLYALGVDAVADRVAAASEPGRVAQAAAARLDAARAATPALVAGEASVAVSAEGLTLSRKLASGMIERASLAGGTLSYDYDQLGLRTRREVGPASAWWLAAEAPWVPPAPSSLEGLVVEVEGATGVRVRAPRVAGTALMPDLALTFDTAGRVAAVAFVRGAERLETRVRYEGELVLVTRPGQATERYRVEASAGAAPAAAAAIEIELPLSNPARWADVLADPTRSPAEVTHARRQLLATYAALEDDSKLASELAALRKVSGKLALGDVVLASGAFGRYSDLRELLTDLPKTEPVVRYLKLASTPTQARSYGALADDHRGSLVGLLSRHRSVLADAEQLGLKKAILGRLASLGAEYPEARFFRYAAARAVVDRVGWQDSDYAVAVWDTLASDRLLGPVADRQVATLISYRDDKQAAARALRAVDGAVAMGIPFTLDWALSSAISRGRGASALELTMARWRRTINETGSARQILGLVQTMVDPYGPMRGAVAADLSLPLRRLDRAPDADEATRVAIAVQLLSAGRLAEAKLVVRPLVEGGAPRPLGLELSVLIAEQEGDLARAAETLDRLLVATEGDALPLSTVRAWYERLVQLHLRRAALTTDAAAEHAISEALAVVARWRKEDLDNIAIDELVATSLFAMGRPEEAKKHLSSIVERRPAEGLAFSRVATVLQREGELDGAITSWSEAARVEPTNPTWMLAHAQALLARGAGTDKQSALELLRKIDAGKWQDRFANVRYEAQRVYESAR